MIMAKQVFVGGLAADWIDDWLATNLWVVRLWFTGLGLSEFPVCAPLGPPPWSLLDLLGSLWAPLRSIAGSPWDHLGLLLGALEPLLGLTWFTLTLRTHT